MGEEWQTLTFFFRYLGKNASANLSEFLKVLSPAQLPDPEEDDGASADRQQRSVSQRPWG